MTKKKNTTFVTPRGTAKYPKLDQPYKWNAATKRMVPATFLDGGYDTKMLIPEKAAKPLIELIENDIKEFGRQPEYSCYSREVDKDTNEPTGNVEFTFKMYGLDYDKQPQKPLFFDAKGRPVKKVVLTGGSEIIISGYIKVSDKSARLNIKSIQLIRLAESSSDVFEVIDEEDVYEANEEEEVNQIDSAKEETTINDKIPF